jgi:polygalacturonase
MYRAHLSGFIGLAPLALALSVGAAHAAGNPCSPTTYGAVADGVIGASTGTDNTAAIQAAINACAQAGGGIVSLSVVNGKGVYQTGPIMLASHVLLEINAGVTLLATADESQYSIAYLDYPAPGTGTAPFMPTKPYEALIFAYKAVDTGIIGTGRIDGQGNVTAPNKNRPAGSGSPSYLGTTGGPYTWWTLPVPPISGAGGATVNGTTYYHAPYEDVPTSNGVPRPWLVEFYDCQNVTVNGITLINSPMWSMVLRYSSNVTVSNYHVQNYNSTLTAVAPNTGPNTDGIDPVGSSFVNISNITVANDDDIVAIKSGLPTDLVNGVQLTPGSDTAEIGLPQMPTHDLVIANSNLVGTGNTNSGISIGSEASNGVYNVTLQNLHEVGTSVGLRIKTGRTRGNYQVGDHDITVENMSLVGTLQPIAFYGYYPSSDGPVETSISSYDKPQVIQQYTPNVYNVTVNGLTATGATGESLIVGVPEACFLNMNLNNVSIQTTNSTAGFQLRHMQGTFTNVTVTDTHGGTTPNWLVQENVNLTTTGSPGLAGTVATASLPVTIPPLPASTPAAPCGRYPLGTTPNTSP